MEAIGAIGIFAGLSVLAIMGAAIGSAVSQSRAAIAAFDAMWRQPEAAGTISTSLTLTLAFMEALTLFVLAVILILSFSIA